MTKLVYGIGYNDRKYPARIGKEKTKSYAHWQKMLMRCYESTIDFNPTYVDCTVSENFKNYSYFHEWCLDQVGFARSDFFLDKDLLVKGNKIYSEDTCVFVPREVNNSIFDCKKTRGLYPMGVSFNKRQGIFEAYIMIEKKRIHLGYYHDPMDAFRVYKKEKEKYFKYIADKYKEIVDHRVYDSLYERTVTEYD